MTGCYQTYPEYKESCVDWFGKIPSHWKVAGFKKHIDSIVDYRGKTPFKTDDGVLLVTARNIKNGKLDYSLSQEFISPDNFDDVMNRGKAEKGHVLFTTEAPLGQVANIDRTNIALAQRIIKFDGLKNELNNFYFKYLIMSEEFQQSLNLFASGSTVKGIKAERFVYLRNLIPPFNEQQNIADFLDHETVKIDTLIAKQEKLIELLKEKRQAVISHAVTRGLPSPNGSNAPMKDSGVEWLGEVPEHWVVTPIKHLAELTPKKSQIQDKKELKCSFVPMDKLKQDSLVLDESKLISEVYDGYTYFENEDVLIAKVTPCFENKNMVVAKNLVNGIGFGSSEIYVLRTNKNILNDFLYYRLQEGSFMDIATAAMTGAGGLKRVPADVITNFSIALPTESEQLEIICFLKERLKQLDLLSSKAKSAILLMKERKTALISAAVTGKIDVRNYHTEKAGS